jgi:hypothetical protein
MKQAYLALLVLILFGLLLMGCGSDVATSSADADQQRKTAKSLKEANAQIGMPAIVNFQERKLAKMIFELRDREDLICYAYIVNHMTGRLVFLGKCVGFGLPYSVQYTNPMKKVPCDLGRWNGETTIPQADPNGLFMPGGLSATWLMMIDPKSGTTHPVYVEPEILVSPFKLH